MRFCNPQSMITFALLCSCLTMICEAVYLFDEQDKPVKNTSSFVGNGKLHDRLVNQVNDIQVDRQKVSNFNSTGGTKVAGGYQAQDGEFPMFVSLKMSADRVYGVCSGVLLNKELILTAAHCIDSKFHTIQAATGVHSPKVWREKNVKPIKVAKVCVSPRYMDLIMNLVPMFYDFAVLRLEEPVELVKESDFACLPEKQLEFGHEVFTLGVGKVNDFQMSDTVQIMPATRIGCYLLDYHPSHICFQSSQEDRIGTACEGDSGGPTLRQDGNRKCVYGLTSYGDPGCERNNLRRWVGANVFEYRDHIRSLMGACSSRGAGGLKNETFAPLLKINKGMLKPRTEIKV